MMKLVGDFSDRIRWGASFDSPEQKAWIRANLKKPGHCHSGYLRKAVSRAARAQHNDGGTSFWPRLNAEEFAALKEAAQPWVEGRAHCVRPLPDDVDLVASALQSTDNWSRELPGYRSPSAQRALERFLQAEAQARGLSLKLDPQAGGTMKVSVSGDKKAIRGLVSSLNRSRVQLYSTGTFQWGELGHRRWEEAFPIKKGSNMLLPLKAEITRLALERGVELKLTTQEYVLRVGVKGELEPTRAFLQDVERAFRAEWQAATGSTFPGSTLGMSRDTFDAGKAEWSSRLSSLNGTVADQVQRQLDSAVEFLDGAGYSISRASIKHWKDTRLRDRRDLLVDPGDSGERALSLRTLDDVLKLAQV